MGHVLTRSGFVIIDEKKRSKSPFGKLFSRKKEELQMEPLSPDEGNCHALH